MKTRSKILPSSKFKKLFRESDLVGIRTERGMIDNSLLKKVAGYWTGNTMYNIIVDLNLWDDKQQKLTKFGTKYFKSIHQKEIISGY